MNNNIVTEIVKDTAAKLKPLDLRAYQAELYRKQRSERTFRESKLAISLRRDKWKNRSKHPRLQDCRVVDTRTSADRSRLYYELSNGQAVRADRILRTRLLHPHPDGTTTIGQSNSARRRYAKPPANPILVDLVLAETIRNAERIS